MSKKLGIGVVGLGDWAAHMLSISLAVSAEQHWWLYLT